MRFEIWLSDARRTKHRVSAGWLDGQHKGSFSMSETGVPEYGGAGVPIVFLPIRQMSRCVVLAANLPAMGEQSCHGRQQAGELEGFRQYRIAPIRRQAQRE